MYSLNVFQIIHFYQGWLTAHSRMNDRSRNEVFFKKMKTSIQ